jgi:hypothetical protein
MLMSRALRYIITLVLLVLSERAFYNNDDYTKESFSHLTYRPKLQAFDDDGFRKNFGKTAQRFEAAQRFKNAVFQGG